MSNIQLVEIITKDNLVHQGIFFRPVKPLKRAILWIHGLTDTFYGDVKTFDEFTKQCEGLEWGFASFNTRGHDIITSTTKIDPSHAKGKTHSIQGAACEKFIDCIYDIDAAISYLEKEGFNEIVLVGISTGANKACYYVATQKDSRVVGVVLASAISDVGIKKKQLGSQYKKIIDKARSLVKKGKGNNFIEGLDYMPITPNRFLSAYAENGDEDVFPYYQNKPTFGTFSKIYNPLLIVMGERDEYADMPVKDILDIYAKAQKSKLFKSEIISGGYHSFGGKEKELVEKIVDWAKNV